MVTAGAVTLVMVAVVLLGNSLIPPKWRGGACLMAGVCPGPENSPDPIGVSVNPGDGLTPKRDGWAPGRREIPGREMFNWSGRAGELGGPARAAPFPLPCGGAVPALQMAGICPDPENSPDP